MATIYTPKKLLQLFFIFFFTIGINSVSAIVFNENVTLDKRNEITLVEHNLWLQTQPTNVSLSFIELTQLYKNAHRVSSTLGGSGAYITKLKLTNSEAGIKTWFVNLHTNYLDKGVAYWRSDSGEIVALENFGQVGGANPKLAHSQTFSLMVNGGDSGELWVYIQAKKFATPVVVKFYNKSTFYDQQFSVNSINTISFTVMMTLGLIACFIYFRIQYLVTLACAGYIGLQGVGWLLASGSFGELFNVTTFNSIYGGMIIFPYAIASACQFTKLLFNCQKEHLKLTKLFNILSLICLALGLIMPFLSFEQSYLVSHIIATVWIPLCISTGVFMLAKKDFRAKYYLVGNLLYGGALVIYMLSHSFHLDLNISPEIIVQIALTIDCACILLSLVEWLHMQQKEYHRSYTVSRIDPLTKVGNRFAQNEFFANLKQDYCITFIDFDGFKAINDSLGHDEGDRFLIDAVNIMQQKLQDIGSMFRSGGDEFIWVVCIDNPQKVEPLIATLSNFITTIELQLKQNGWKNVGLSYGIANSFEAANQSACLSLADQRMYKCKESKKHPSKMLEQKCKRHDRDADDAKEEVQGII